MRGIFARNIKVFMNIVFYKCAENATSSQAEEKTDSRYFNIVDRDNAPTETIALFE